MSQSRNKVIADINKRKNNPFVCIKICTCKLVKVIHHCHWIVPDEQALMKQGNVWNQQLFISKYCLIEGKVMGGSGLQRKGQEMFWVKQLRASRVPEIISPWFGCWARIRVYLQAWLSLPCSEFSNLPEVENYHCCTELDTWGELNWEWKGLQRLHDKGEGLLLKWLSSPPMLPCTVGRGPGVAGLCRWAPLPLLFHCSRSSAGSSPMEAC